jgi:arylformamidase
MRRVEISGPLEEGMWYYEVLYPPVTVEEVAPIGWPHGDGKIYGQKITFGSQAGTHIATGAHIYEDKPDIASIPLDRFICSAVIARVAAGPLGRITLGDVRTALEEDDTTPGAGEALLIATGWDRHWNTERYLAESPRLAADLVDWVLSENISLLGADIPLYDANWDENFWPALYASSTMPLAPLVNLGSIDVSRARLVALPLAIKGSCGSPCRAFLEIEEATS